MKYITNKIGLAIIVFCLITISGCVDDDFSEPPQKDIPVGEILTIQDLYDMFKSDSINNKDYKFTTDYSLYAVVGMDDKGGNIYKSAYVQDAQRGINLHLMSSGGLYEGDSIRIYLKGLILSEYSGMMQLDSVFVDDNIVKIATQKHIIPEVVTINDIAPIDVLIDRPYMAKLVKLENVQFKYEDIGKTFANADDLITENRTLEDENGNTIIVRTSGYASFAGKTIPEGRGNITAIVSKFNDDWQLYIRSTKEINFDERRFGDVDTIFFEGFDDVENGMPISHNNWQNISEAGNIKWLGNIGSENSTARIAGNQQENISWLISPQIDATNAKLSFESRAGLYTGAKLKVYISTDYDGNANPQNFTWTELNPNISEAPSSSFGEWTNSGALDLSNFTGQIYCAFKFESTAGQSAQYYLDNILIYSN